MQDAKIAKRLEQVDLLKTEAKDNVIIVQKSLELFQADNFKEERDEYIKKKMYILGMNQWSLISF